MMDTSTSTSTSTITNPIAKRRRPIVQSLAWPGVALALIVGLGLIMDGAGHSSATYDEVAYQRIAARWWRTGDQSEITRMGSPLTFWKLQQAHALWWFDRCGLGRWIDEPERFQAESLPWLRIAASWTWIAAFAFTVAWAARMHGPGAAVAAAWLFALSPNLLAHGGLITMETPLIACTAGIFWMFWEFLRHPRQRRDSPSASRQPGRLSYSLRVWASRMWASRPRLANQQPGRPDHGFLGAGSDRAWWLGAAILCGLAFSCKFTTIVLGPMLALAWWIMELRGPGSGRLRRALQVMGGMFLFTLVAIAANLVFTGFAMLPISAQVGEHPALIARFGPGVGGWLGRLVESPIPQDWVGFLTQMSHQRNGGPSYLFGEVRDHGWWYYYFAALAVKAPLSLGLLVVARAFSRPTASSSLPPSPPTSSWLLIVWISAFLAVVAIGSSRNYGVRYVLPLAPLAIVWFSGLANAGRIGAFCIVLGVVGHAHALVLFHPHELSYFNELVGGPRGGRMILADSNLDWGQGARALARLQTLHPELQDLTTFYFGDTHPAHYGVLGEVIVVNAVMNADLAPPLKQRVKTRFVAVSSSLQYGPWSKPLGYFATLDVIQPYMVLDDYTISIYEINNN